MGAAPVITISKDVGTRSEYLQVLGAQIPYLVDVSDASATVQLGEFPILEDELIVKVRKPYTVTKQREKWTEGEHQRFLEALKLYGRGWRQIEEHIGTKNAVQIRSHAQKFFSKLEREQATGGNLADSVHDIHIPPARPKRKPNHPYPRKAGAGPDAAGQAAITAATRQNCLASASDMFSSKASTGCVVAGSYFQNAVSTSLQVYSARKESDQMQPGGIMSPLLCSSAGLKIFGQTFAPGIQSSTDSEQTMLDSNDACVNDMSAAKDCGTVVKEALSFSESINRMQSVEDLDIRSSPPDNSVESNCASDATQVKISEEEILTINSINEALCITKENWKSKESPQCLKTASKANGNTDGIEHKVECKFPRASNLKFSDGSCHQRNLCTSKLNCSVAETVDAATAAAVATLAAASAWWALQESMAIGISNDHGFPLNAPHLAAVHSAATLAFTNAFYSLNGSKEALTREFPAGAGTDIATHQLQDPKTNFKERILSRGENTCHLITNTNLTISDQNIRKAVPTSCTSSNCDGKKGVGGSTGRDFSTQGKCIASELGKNHNRRLSSLSECNQSTSSLAVGLTQEHTLSNSYACNHLKKQVSSFSSHEEQGLDEHKKMLNIKDQRHSEVGIVKHSSIEFTGDLLSLLEQQHCSKEDEDQRQCNSEYQQCQSRVAPRNSAAHVQEARDKRSKRLKDCDFSFMDNPDAQRESLIRIISEGDLPCAKTGTHIKILDLVTGLGEENAKACQEARNRSTPSPDSVLNFDEISRIEKLSALNSLQGSSSPSRKRTYSSAVGFQPYQRPFRRTAIALSSSSNE